MPHFKFVESRVFYKSQEYFAHNTADIKFLLMRSCAALSMLRIPRVIGEILDRTKTRNRLGNGSKTGSIELEICSPSGLGKSFHGRGLSALVTRTSM